MRNTKKLLSLLLVSAFVAMAATAAWSFGNKAPTKSPEEQGSGATPDNIPDDAPVALVNGSPITKKEFELAVKSYMKNVQNQMGGKHDAQTMVPNIEIKNEILTQMIDRELLFQEIAKHEFQGIDEKVEAEFARALGSFPSEEEFDAYLASEGIDRTELRKLMERRLVLQEYFTTVVLPEIKVTDEQVSSFYMENPDLFEQPERVRASHILISAAPGDAPEKKEAAKTKAEDARTRALAGEDFAELAKVFSEGPSGKTGGDLGFFTRGRMVPAFEEAAFKLKVGDVSDVVETQFGYHVIKCFEKEEAGKVSLDEVKERIEDHLRNQQGNEAMKAKVTELKADAKVELLTPHL